MLSVSGTAGILKGSPPFWVFFGFEVGIGEKKVIFVEVGMLSA